MSAARQTTVQKRSKGSPSPSPPLLLPRVQAGREANERTRKPDTKTPCQKCNRAKKLPKVGGTSSKESPSYRPKGLLKAKEEIETATPEPSFPTPTENMISTETQVSPEVSTNIAKEVITSIVSEEDKVKEEERRALEAEAARKKEMGNGHVRLRYEMYDEEFSIIQGTMTQSDIDEVYALSFVMPECRIHLSTLDPETKRKADIAGMFDIYVKEIPLGTYQGLEKGTVYYVYVEQEATRLERDQQLARQRAEQRRQTLDAEECQKIERDDGRVLDSCTCIYGNPCLDEYGCRDWSHRFEISGKNGWKGF